MVIIASPDDLTVQPHGVTDLVNQFNAIDSARAARGAADFVHELEQHAGAQVRGQTPSGVDPEMQHRESFMGRSNENRDPDGSAVIGNREQGLHAGNVADAYAQAAVL